jgi:hypothetical protein
MVTEPIEAIIAILLISIVLYSVFVYNQRGVENILIKRALAKSVAGTVAGIYVNYLNSSQSFEDFNRSVANFLSYIEKKENVSCSAYLRLLFKNGTYFDYQLFRGRSGKTSITENVTVALGSIGRSLTVRALANRSFVSTAPIQIPGGGTLLPPVGVYVVAYYENGVHPSSLTASVSISDGGPPQTCSLERSFTGGAIYSCSAPLTAVGKEVSLYIYVNDIKVDGTSYPDLHPIPIPGKPLSYTGNVRIGDTDVHYYLGEEVSLTESANWILENRKGMRCTRSGGSIPTGSSSYLCPEVNNLPLPVFLVQGPIYINISQSQTNICDSDDTSCSRQVIFIEPYFSQISVTLAKG